MPNLPPVSVLLDRYTCDPDDGLVRIGGHASNYQRRFPIGHVLGRLDRDGYLGTNLTFLGKTYSVLLHRLAWVIYYHEYAPNELQVDHINRVRTDNRKSNLRLATARENCLNSAATRKDASIPSGISRLVRHGRVRYQAAARRAGKPLYLGVYDTPDEAALAVSNWRGE